LCFVELAENETSSSKKKKKKKSKAAEKKSQAAEDDKPRKGKPSRAAIKVKWEELLLPPNLCAYVLNLISRENTDPLSRCWPVLVLLLW